MLILSFFAVQPAAAQGRPPGGNFDDPAIRAVDIAEPAIVRLGTLYQGSITFDLCGRADTLPGGGQTLTIAGLGTGAFINANGDILTADHVVNISKSDLDGAIFQILANDIANLLNANASCLGLGGIITPDQISDQSILDAGIPFSTSYSVPEFLSWLNTSYTGPDTTGAADSTDPLTALMQAQHMTATLEGYSQFTDNDLAVLHINMTNTPSISLGNSDDVAVQDHLTSIGFPGNGDASHPDATYDTTDLVTPTVDSLDVVAIKSNDNGASLIQASGALEHGDSGGPALDANGNIVGIVSYSGTDDPIGSFFLRSSNSARALLSSSGIDTHPGSFETQWRQAFEDYSSTANGHWHTAASELDALSVQYPNFRGVLPFKQYADEAELNETALGGGDLSLVAIISLATALLALAVLVIIILTTRSRRRRQRRQQASAVPTPTFPGTYNPYDPYGAYNPYAYGAYGYGSYPPGYGPPPAAGPPAYGYRENGPLGIQRPTIGQPESPQSGQFLPEQSQSAPSSPVQPQINTADVETMLDLMTASPTGQISSDKMHMSASLPNNPTSAGPQQPSGTSATPYEMMGASEASGRTAATMRQNTCTNGHAMMRDEIYCNVCGMPRASTVLPQTFTQWPGQNG